MTVGQATAKRIDDYLDERGITLYRLAKDACVPASTLQNLYRDHTKSPTVALVFKLTDALGVSIQEFFSSPLFSPENLEID
ncbi:MAG: helix-turn-helix transcriptional regulator [Clostridiales bacterium]|nr:helix-turn-helix transcriptional regulator [Clostridiales bacterium]